MTAGFGLADEKLVLESELLKNGATVREAFRDVVADARRWTVEILRDEKPAVTGAIVGADGWILTKASELPPEPACRLHDQRQFPARLAGIDYDWDLALLKIEASDLPSVQWSTQGDPGVGQWLATPGLAEVPVSVGVVGAARMEIPAKRGLLGVAAVKQDRGLTVQSIQAQSGAARAGLKQDDVIETLNDGPLATYAELVERLRPFQPGDTVALGVIREGKPLSMSVTLGESFSSFVARSGFQNRLGGDLSRRRSGFRAAIQHDSLLDPHECGGTAVDLNGKAVGINIARGGRTATFVVPVDEVLPVIENLKAGKLDAPTTARYEELPPPEG
jgi:serine protease Do